MFSAWPLSGRSPVSGSTSAYLTDELPELRTRTRPAEPGEPAMAGMLPVAGYESRSDRGIPRPGPGSRRYGYFADRKFTYWPGPYMSLSSVNPELGEAPAPAGPRRPWAIPVPAAGLIVTAAAGLAAAWGLTTLGLKPTGDPRISLLLTAVWAVAPGSVVLTMMYAEALFCALAVWALVALVSRRWLTAGLLTLAAGTVRSTAVALIAAVTVAAAIAVIA